ncbi:MAG: hypothetical protein ABJP48_04680 [Erythrobacter sp.]
MIRENGVTLHFRLGFMLIMAACAGTASAQSATHDADLVAEREAIERFQAIDQRLQDIGWRLATGNAAFCPDVAPAIGLQLHDLASYGEPDIARAALDLTGYFAVQTAAANSPAGAVSSLSQNREIIGLNGVNPNSWPAEEKYHWQRLVLAHDFIDRALAETGELAVRFADGSGVTLTAKPACATRFELSGSGRRAVADGKRVVIGVEFVGFTYAEDELAAAIAHELAHNLLGHRAWLDEFGRGRRNVRKTEREADRLMPWLLANAGYDPRAAQRFMTRWGPANDRGIFRARTHDGWDERAEFIAAEIPVIEQLMAEAGMADWGAHFRREIDPQAER